MACRENWSHNGQNHHPQVQWKEKIKNEIWRGNPVSTFLRNLSKFSVNDIWECPYHECNKINVLSGISIQLVVCVIENLIKNIWIIVLSNCHIYYWIILLNSNSVLKLHFTLKTTTSTSDLAPKSMAQLSETNVFLGLVLEKISLCAIFAIAS